MKVVTTKGLVTKNLHDPIRIIPKSHKIPQNRRPIADSGPCRILCINSPANFAEYSKARSSLHSTITVITILTLLTVITILNVVAIVTITILINILYLPTT